jgi:cell fate regulator YaaT (PSP1 superfamily)
MYFDKVDQGEQIIVQRGKDKSYALTPINEDDVYFKKKMVERIKQSIKQAQDGDYIEISTSKEIKELLGL